MAGDWIQTYTGKKFYPLEPHRNTYDIDDIAHALSLKCRFGGHVLDSVYSVAEHSIRVAEILPDELKLHGLLHDAAEAYLPDILSPIKRHVQITVPWHAIPISFSDLENELMYFIGFSLGLDVRYEKYKTPPLVKQADLILLMTEARDLMGKPPEKWSLTVEPLPEKITPMSPMWAEEKFLRMYEKLTEKQGGG